MNSCTYLRLYFQPYGFLPKTMVVLKYYHKQINRKEI